MLRSNQLPFQKDQNQKVSTNQKLIQKLPQRNCVEKDDQCFASSEATTDKSSMSINQDNFSSQQENFIGNTNQQFFENDNILNDLNHSNLCRILMVQEQMQHSSDEQISEHQLLLRKIHYKNEKLLEKVHKNKNHKLKQIQIESIKKFQPSKLYKKYLSSLLSSNHVKLQDLYHSTNKNINKEFNFSKFNYYNSLIPKLQILSKHKNIVFQISKMSNLNGANRLLPQNSVNIHLFKPFYVQEQNHIKCFVPTEAIMKHALMALYHIHDYYQYEHPKIYVNQNITKIVKLIQNWEIFDYTIICRVESLLTYLLIQWCKFKDIPFDTLKKIILQIQFSRLNPKRISFQQLINETLLKQNLISKDFFQYFKIKKQTSASKFIYGYNFKYKNREISAVMLPWGLQLAKEVTQTLFMINGNIKKVGIVGGVGYTGNKQCKVDDIFIPTTFMSGNDYHYSIQNAINAINGEEEDTIHFRDFKVVTGCIKSVYPEIGKLSSLQVYRKVIHNIDALDMEFQAIHKVIKQQPNCTLGSIYYIMDLPKKGIHLGNTYYTKQFLQNLFSKFQRGKFYCFQKVLNYITKEQVQNHSV